MWHAPPAWCRACALAAALWLPYARAAEPEPERITEIRFVGNKVTRPAILLQEMLVRPGDAVDAALIERSRQAIMDLGLFERVETELQPAEYGEGEILVVSLREKIYVLPLPRLNRNADGDISYGAQLRADNLFGLNQGLRFTVEETKPASGDANDIQELRLDYDYPRLAGTPYGLTINASRVEETRDVPDLPGQHFDVSSRSFGFSITRLLERYGPTRGWRVYSGMILGRTEYTYEPGTPVLYPDDNRLALTGGARFSDVRNYLYSRAGEAYGYSAEFGVPFDYQQHNLYFRQYNLITRKPHYSLDYQLQLGYAEGTIGAYALGGSGTLRGYPRASVEGNVFLLGNFEYLQPLFGYRSLRALVFLDVGNAYPKFSEVDPLDLKASVGVGLRYVLKSFVNIQLRLDYGYALDGGSSKTYAGTKDTF